jgi:hypothetical protein
MPSATASFRRRARLGTGRGKIISSDFLCDACGGAIHLFLGKELPKELLDRNELTALFDRGYGMLWWQ